MKKKPYFYYQTRKAVLDEILKKINDEIAHSKSALGFEEEAYWSIAVNALENIKTRICCHECKCGKPLLKYRTRGGRRVEFCPDCNPPEPKEKEEGR